MSVRDFKAMTYADAYSDKTLLRMSGTLEYAARDFIDRSVVEQIRADLAEASDVANRAIFTDEFARLIAERHAAALEGALKGLRKRRLMDEGNKP